MDLERMFDDLFTTYSSLDPPPIERKTSNLTDLDLKEIDPNLYKQNMVATIDSPDINWSLDQQEIFNPFSFQTDEPSFSPSKPSQSTSSSLAQSAVDLARSFIGGNYVYGGKDPNQGFDCSGLISYVYKQSGVDIPATTFELFKTGTEVSLSNAQVGDIICTPGSGRSGRHVKMISRIEDGQIYTIEAKGRKYGIVETPLNKTDNIITIRRISQSAPYLQSIQASTIQFGSNRDYAQTMYQYLYDALENNGIDGSTWAPILTAHTSIESGWGNKFSRENNNFGGIKGKGSKTVSTREWSPTKGYYTIKDTFKSYPSVEAFADDYVKMLKNKFKAFDGTPGDYLRNIRKHGYFTASLSDYQRIFNGRLNNINTLLNS